MYTSKIVQILKSFAFKIHHVIMKLCRGSWSVCFVFINIGHEGAFSFKNFFAFLPVMALESLHSHYFIFVVLVKSFV